MTDDKLIEKVSSVTYLGVVINKHLTWQDHIDYICNKINNKLSPLRRIKSCLPLEARLLFFNSYILPIFDYADVIWGDRGNVALMKQLQVLQNKAERITQDLPPRASATEALHNLRWKRLSRRRAEHRAIFMFNCLNNWFTHSFDIVVNREYHDRIGIMGIGVFGTRQLLPQMSGIIWISP